VYDRDQLNLLLPPGARFYIHEGAHASSERLTVEVFYSER